MGFVVPPPGDGLAAVHRLDDRRRAVRPRPTELPEVPPIPAGALEDVRAAEAAFEALAEEGLQIRFARDETGRLRAVLADLDGEPLRELPLPDVLEPDYLRPER